MTGGTQRATKVCPLCGDRHNETIEMLVDAEVRRIPDGELAAERLYVDREIHDATRDRAGILRHRLAILKDEERRRRRVAAKGGPVYRGRSSIPQEKIAEAKAVNITDLIARDLDIAWMRGKRTWFYCPAHGDGHDRNPSLVAFEDQRRWWCFGCGSGGDSIDWLIARHGMSFHESVEALS